MIEDILCDAWCFVPDEVFRVGFDGVYLWLWRCAFDAWVEVLKCSVGLV